MSGNMNQAGNTPVNNIGPGGGYGSSSPNVNACQTGPNSMHLMAGQMQHMSARMGGGGTGQQTMTQQQHANISMQSQNNQVNFFFNKIFNTCVIIDYYYLRPLHNTTVVNFYVF